MDIQSKEHIERIRSLNDSFRRTFYGGKVFVTSGVEGLPDLIKLGMLQLVRTFNDFDEGNDPHGEHDFGGLEFAGRSFLWKIDYYDPSCEFGSEDPSDPKKTTRVLTVMLVEEY